MCHPPSSKLSICLVALLVPQILGFSIQYRGNTKHPTLSKHCFYEEYNLAIPLNGTDFPVNQENLCARVHCRDDYVLMIKHCERMQLADGCHFTEYNYSVPYPDCCARRVCPNEIN